MMAPEEKYGRVEKTKARQSANASNASTWLFQYLFFTALYCERKTRPPPQSPNSAYFLRNRTCSTLFSHIPDLKNIHSPSGWTLSRPVQVKLAVRVMRYGPLYRI